MLEPILLVMALSIDAFAASIAYGANKIKVPFKSVIVINLICTGFLGISLLIGSGIRLIVPPSLLTLISFLILLLLGTYYLFESFIKTYLIRVSNINKQFNIKLFDIKFIIDVYGDKTKADLNSSKDLSPMEAIYLATALSLDSIVAGFGSSIVNINCIQVMVLSLVFGTVAIWIGLVIGKRLAASLKADLSWIGGIILIMLAIMKLF
ncbi:MAG: sporulation membrane protein YtaF [Clostridiales bacterium]|nr:sporulation membrane protein YtaF [Clostridiales bacterium]